MAASDKQPFSEIRAEVEAELLRHFGEAEATATVGLAMRESVLAPAKRLRPVLTVVAARDLGFRSTAALRAGCAVELVHTASLLLDDLPCMDDAKTRRGKPAIHVRFGEDVAILAAIALLSDAYGMAASLPDVSGATSARLVTVLSNAIGLNGLVAGQYRDLHGAAPLDQAEASSVNDQKTGSLFCTCLDMAAALAGTTPLAEQHLQTYGREIGRAFQLFDDLLDVDGDAVAMGKDTGRDGVDARLASTLDRDAMTALIRSHVTAARAALAGLPVRAKGLSELTDHLFGAEEKKAEPTRGAKPVPAMALMPSFLAR